MKFEPERWGSPLIQEKYQEEKTCDKRHPYNNNNNNNYYYYYYHYYYYYYYYYFYYPVSYFETCNYIRQLPFDSEIYFCFIGHSSGIESETNIFGPRILGGRNAYPREFPFQVSHRNDMVIIQWCFFPFKVDSRKK